MKKTQKTLVKLFIVFIVLNIFDYSTTVLGLSLGATELNPVMDYLFSLHIILPLLIKFVTIAFLWVWMQYRLNAKKIELKWYIYLMTGANAVYFLAILSNIRTCHILLTI